MGAEQSAFPQAQNARKCLGPPCSAVVVKEQDAQPLLLELKGRLPGLGRTASLAAPDE